MPEQQNNRKLSGKLGGRHWSFHLATKNKTKYVCGRGTVKLLYHSQKFANRHSRFLVVVHVAIKS